MGKKFGATIEGVKVLKENTIAVLLLQRYEGPLTKDEYVCTDDFKDKFIINQKTKSSTPQSIFLRETVTFGDLINLK